MPTLRVKSVRQRIRNGYTHPFDVECSDGKRYVLKCLSDRSDDGDEVNGKALFNEVVAARYAKALGLPIPDWNIIELPKSIVTYSEEMSALKVHAGPAFGSLRQTGSTGIDPVILRKVSNPNDIANIILFDQLILNVDRGNNQGNLFYEKKSKRVMIIDHTNIFRLAQIWDETELKKCETEPPTLSDDIREKYYKYLAHFVHGPKPFKKIQHSLKLLTKNDFNYFVSDIPNEWNISKEDKEAASHFLYYQARHVDEIIKLLHETILTQWKGVS